MHIIRQILLLKFFIGCTVVFGATFTVAFLAVIGTVREDDQGLQYTSKNLATLSNIERSIDMAAADGRAALFNGAGDRQELESKRDQSIKLIDQSVEELDDADAKVGQFDYLKGKLIERYELQDEQLRSSSRKDGTVVLVEETSQQVNKVTFDLDRVISQIRLAELNFLFEKKSQKIKTQWNIIYLMILFMSLSTISISLLTATLLRELKHRKSVAEQLHQNVHVSLNGEQIFTKKEMDQIMRMLEEGEEALGKAKE